MKGIIKLNKNSRYRGFFTKKNMIKIVLILFISYKTTSYIKKMFAFPFKMFYLIVVAV